MWNYVFVSVLLLGFSVESALAGTLVSKNSASPSAHFLLEKNRDEKYKLYATSTYAIKKRHHAIVQSACSPYGNIKKHFSDNKKVVNFANKRIDKIRKSLRKKQRMVFEKLKEHLHSEDTLYHYVFHKEENDGSVQKGLLILSKDGKLRKKFPNFGANDSE